MRIGWWWGVHIIIKKHFTLLNICVVASYPNSGNLERRGFFLGGGGGVHSAHYDKELHCTVYRLCCSWLYLSVPDSPLITCILVSHRVTVRRRYVFVQTVWELWETPVEWARGPKRGLRHGQQGRFHHAEWILTRGGTLVPRRHCSCSAHLAG